MTVTTAQPTLDFLNEFEIISPRFFIMLEESGWEFTNRFESLKNNRKAPIYRKSIYYTNEAGQKKLSFTMYVYMHESVAADGYSRIIMQHRVELGNSSSGFTSIRIGDVVDPNKAEERITTIFQALGSPHREG